MIPFRYAFLAWETLTPAAPALRQHIRAQMASLA